MYSRGILKQMIFMHDISEKLAVMNATGYFTFFLELSKKILKLNIILLKSQENQPRKNVSNSLQLFVS